MKKTLYVLLLLVITAMLALPAAPVSADQDTNSRAAILAMPTLMIKAAGQVASGQPLTITIYSKYGHETIAGVSVYAVRTDDMVIAADSDNYTTLLNQYEMQAVSKGILLGTTGTDGKVTGTFTQTGRYMLVAVRSGYVPGFTRLTVTLAAQKALNVKSPGFVTAGQPVTITVTARYSQQPVSGAAVYAQQVTTLSSPFLNQVPRPIVAATDNTSSRVAGKPVPMQVIAASQHSFNFAVIKADPADTTAALKYAEQVRSNGVMLGNTGADGSVTYTFTTSGYYVMTAVLDGYAPGFGRITVTGSQKKLVLQTPGSAIVDAKVTFLISESGTAVSGASLWMLRTNDIKGTDESIWESLVANKALNDVIDKYKGWAREKGKLIGTSDASGQVSYAFQDTGTYLLVAVKDGYTPGFGRIKISKEILESRLQLGLKASTPAYINRPVTLKAFERKSGKAVDKATIYGFKGIHPTVRPSPSLKENGTATAMIIDASAADEISSNEAGKLLVQSQFQPMLIGTTGSNGELRYTFTEASGYTLVAFKDGYVAGGCRVNVLPEPADTTGSLGISISITMSGGQASTIHVLDKDTQQPVVKAAVYVLKTAETGRIMQKGMPAISNTDKSKNDANRAKTSGSFAGYTDANGQLAWTFGTSAQYLVAAFKAGYEPAFTTITTGTITANTDN